jgi:hypothetical protein
MPDCTRRHDDQDGGTVTYTLRSRGILLGLVSCVLLLASAPGSTATAGTAVGTTTTPAVVVQVWLSNSWITKPGSAWVLDPTTVLVSGSVVLAQPGGLGTPAPPGRQVSLQQRAGQRWRTVATTRTDRNHVATFGVKAPAAGTYRLASSGGTSETFAVHRARVGFAALAANWSFASAVPNAPSAELRVCLLGAPAGNATRTKILLQRHDARGWHTTASRTTARSYNSSRCENSVQFWAPKGTGTFRLVVPRWGLTIAHVYGRAS